MISFFQPYHETGIEDVVNDVAVFKWAFQRLLCTQIIVDGARRDSSINNIQFKLKLFSITENQLTQERVCTRSNKSITKITTVSSTIMPERIKWR